MDDRDEIEQIRATLAERETRLQTEPLHTLQAQIYCRNVRALLDALDAAEQRAAACERELEIACAAADAVWRAAKAYRHAVSIFEETSVVPPSSAPDVERAQEDLDALLALDATVPT